MLIIHQTSAKLKRWLTGNNIFKSGIVKKIPPPQRENLPLSGSWTDKKKKLHESITLSSVQRQND